MNEDEELPVMYEDDKTAFEAAFEISVMLTTKAAQWEEEARLELAKAAGDRNLYNALMWGAGQLHLIKQDINEMSITTTRFGTGEDLGGSLMFTEAEVDAAVAAAVEAYERNRPADPFTPNPEVLNSNADRSGETPEAGTVFVDNGNIAEVVEAGSEDDPFIGETDPNSAKEMHRAVVAGFVADDDFLDRVTEIRQYIINFLDQSDLDAFDISVSEARKSKA